MKFPKEMRMAISWEQHAVMRHDVHAMHEAGHAAMLYLWGDASDKLVHIGMIWNDERAAYVRRRTGMDFWSLTNVVQVPRGMLRNAAYREIIFNLAGPAAQNRVEDKPEERWLNDYFENCCGFDPNPDFDDSLRHAIKVTGTQGRAFRMLDCAARWTDELLSIPRVWATVEALAANLKHGKKLSGAKACAIMDEAFEPVEAIPAFDLGPLWRRRLFGPMRRYS